MTQKLIEYLNGNSTISLYSDGTRIIEFDNQLELNQPLNIDIRIFNRCSNGFNPKTNRAICSYCHESQMTEGDEANYETLKNKLSILDSGIELAIGANEINKNFIEFLYWCKSKSFFVNLTINQLHLEIYKNDLIKLIKEEVIYGLGISYRKDYNSKIDPIFINYDNSVLHVIAGIDTIEDVIKSPFNKVLVLGYKTFGFGTEFYSTEGTEVDKNLKQWLWNIPKLINKKSVVSFDNLGIEQLNIKRFFFEESNWNTFYQGEYSLYINAVEEYFAPSSRTNENKVNWNSINIKEYFQKYVNV